MNGKVNEDGSPHGIMSNRCLIGSPLISSSGSLIHRAKWGFIYLYYKENLIVFQRPNRLKDALVWLLGFPIAYMCPKLSRVKSKVNLFLLDISYARDRSLRHHVTDHSSEPDLYLNPILIRGKCLDAAIYTPQPSGELANRNPNAMAQSPHIGLI